MNLKIRRDVHFHSDENAATAIVNLFDIWTKLKPSEKDENQILFLTILAGFGITSTLEATTDQAPTP